MTFSELDTPRREIEFEVVIVGGGPAGLAAALHLGEVEPGVSIAVVEKGKDFGAHILSGAVIDPVGLDELVPEWRDEIPHMLTPVTKEKMFWLEKNKAQKIPLKALPPFMSNKNAFVGSLGKVCQYLGEKAEANGVEAFVGYSASELMFDEQGAVNGVGTNDIGVRADGTPGANFERGVILRAKYVLLGEGARGSLTQQAIARYGLDKDCQPQKYGLGIKEIWQVPSSKSKPGLIQHYLGWPLDDKTGGGGFVYHIGDRKVAVGHVLHLDYKNPFMDPFQEMQKFKTHPQIRETLEGAKRIEYGARAIATGGYQSVPKLAFVGGALLGDSAGFMNLVRLKGSHNAILSGMLTAKYIGAAIGAGRSNDKIEGLDQAWQKSFIGKDLRPVRNFKPLLSRYGTGLGMMFGGIDMWWASIFGRPLFGSMAHKNADHETLGLANKHKAPDYPAIDRKLVFDKKSSVDLSGTQHRASQSAHLKIIDPDLHETSEWGKYGGPSVHYCPAGVYEWRQRSGRSKLIINGQNCLHCKTCDIKDPNQNIIWNPPGGGDGPDYSNM